MPSRRNMPEGWRSVCRNKNVVIHLNPLGGLPQSATLTAFRRGGALRFIPLALKRAAGTFLRRAHSQRGPLAKMEDKQVSPVPPSWREVSPKVTEGANGGSLYSLAELSG